MYKKQWSEFEVQSLAYGILRKHLYPTYLVRGEYKFPSCRCDIVIFKADETGEPKPVLVLEIKKTSNGTSSAQGTRYETIVGVPCIYIRGIDDAYKVLEAVQPYLSP